MLAVLTPTSIVVAAAATVAAGVVAAAWPGLWELDVGLVLLLLAFVAIAELSGFEISDRSSYSISTVPTIAAGMLLGLPGAVVVAPASALIRGIRRRSPWYRVLFNTSTYVLAAAAATAVFGLSGVSVAPASILSLMIPAALAGLAYFLHTGLVALVMAAELRVSPLPVWSARFRWLAPHYVMLSFMSLLLALAYRELGSAGAVAFVVPPIMMRFVAKRSVDQTLASMRELQALNQQLASEVARRTAAEQENAALYREAREAVRTRDEFLSVAAHELKTPIMSLRLRAQHLASGLVGDDPAQRAHVGRAVTVIDRQSESLSQLVDRLLDISRIDAGKLTIEPRPVDIAALVASVAADLQVRTTRHQLLVNAPSRIEVFADPVRLEQVFTNLLDNAITYSPDGGRIDVDVVCLEEGSVRVAVRDRGLGIPAEHYPHVFDRFYRAHDRHHLSGLGLGLYISREIVELHGGTMLVECPPDGGTRFSVTLPPGEVGDRAATDDLGARPA
jgi:signal transduction histidine kinase